MKIPIAEGVVYLFDEVSTTIAHILGAAMKFDLVSLFL